MKKVFLLLLLFTIVFADKNYSQSLHRQKHEELRTDRKTIPIDTCQRIQSYIIFQSSNEVNKRAEFSTAPVFVCPITDDVYRRILGRAFGGILIPY